LRPCGTIGGGDGFGKGNLELSLELIMGRSGLTKSTVAMLVIAAGCGLAAADAAALPMATPGGPAEAANPVVQPAAHKQKYWVWDGAWWRHGPWADHGIQGMVITGPWSAAVFVPWGAHRLRACAAKYRSFDAASGTYVAAGGKRRICR
jgi:hypothetical protein